MRSHLIRPDPVATHEGPPESGPSCQAAMPRHCRRCHGPMRLTKRLVFEEGSAKLIFECARCSRAVVEEESA